MAQDVSAAEIRDHLADSGLLPAECPLTPTYQPRIRGQLDHNKLAPLGAHQKDFHLVDLHVSPQFRDLAKIRLRPVDEAVFGVPFAAPWKADAEATAIR